MEIICISLFSHIALAKVLVILQLFSYSLRNKKKPRGINCGEFGGLYNMNVFKPHKSLKMLTLVGRRDVRNQMYSSLSFVWSLLDNRSIIFCSTQTSYRSVQWLSYLMGKSSKTTGRLDLKTIVHSTLYWFSFGDTWLRFIYSFPSLVISPSL